MSGVAAETLQRAFRRACALDVQARKPGNVSTASAGHGMQAGLFIASAAAATVPLCERGARVGTRIEAAMNATLAVAQCNTNLGILLLCAPLAAACESWSPEDGVDHLRRELEQVLRRLDLDDARAAYRAIAAAHPGGLGAAPQQDVAEAPTIGLREAMALAADRDRIAHQYLSAHADVFELGVPSFAARLQQAPTDPAAAMQQVFLEFLSAFPDSHIVRKHGDAVAHSVMAEATPWRHRARSGERLDADPAFAAWDESLKSRAINPGTSADLCVATAMVVALRRTLA
jgi:triphosphoribosyl-dephospho-CoA synthase